MTENSKNSTLTLSDLYDETIVYNSRPSYVSNPWLKPEEHQSNFLTGREMIISNKMPMIVHEASVTDRLQQLFEIVGRSIPSHIYKFHNRETYEEVFNQIVNKEKKKIYFQYIHSEDVITDDCYAVDKEVFVALNNKARIPEWTNHKYLPEREIVSINDFKARIKDWSFPFVIKPGDDLPTAGGYGVMICYNEEDLEKATQRIFEASDATDNLIIEQKIEAVKNFCVQYAYSEELGIQYLGTAHQITNEYGFYAGNENVHDVPQQVIDAGREIMENGVKLGFFGVAGFDLLLDEHGDVFAIDLNFRQNGSTSMLLLQDELNPNYQKFYSYFSKGDNEKFFNTILKYVKQGVLYPLSYYDGDWYGKNEVNSRFGCIWHANSKEEVEQLEQAFISELEK
ncbi:L-aspartate--L-methionine ligase LdmS [Staphylococcus caledonicus]|uniref:L-aspartate--L-methionine ligase LdmS n=1 Tax=Staphylococcus caledonicus TaxID=2741333 RepID=UPI0018E46539|nr:ATP-grasp domain-containing protein [Staphylococcus caledonicus]MBI5973797.1 ATP-grasp domain-containing protein [Staphylococcus caledonicus]